MEAFGKMAFPQKTKSKSDAEKYAHWKIIGISCLIVTFWLFNLFSLVFALISIIRIC